VPTLVPPRRDQGVLGIPVDDARRGVTVSGAPASTEKARSFGGGVRVLSIGIAATGLLTFAFFSIASHVLNATSYGRVTLLWSVMFVTISVIYRPIEQLLSRTIADQNARGLNEHFLRFAGLIQVGFCALFLGVALPLREEVVANTFNGSSFLYWVLVTGTLLYAASYFARGWLAGHKYFGLYGGLVLMEATSRLAFGIAAAVGITSGQNAVALGIAAAPFVSLVVVPAAFARRDVALLEVRGSRGGSPTDSTVKGDAADGVEEAAEGLSLRHGVSFVIAVAGVMLAEQVLLNVAVLTTNATVGHALAGIVFSVMLIARAPLQLFQAVQTSLLPHLAGLEATQGHAAFSRAIRYTLLVIAGFAGAVALALLLIGPFAMSHLFGQHYQYGRIGLAIVGVAVGMHLASGTLNQAALARGHARGASLIWIGAGLACVIFNLAPLVSDHVLRAEVGYLFGTLLLISGLSLLYRFTSPPSGDAEHGVGSHGARSRGVSRLDERARPRTTSMRWRAWGSGTAAATNA